MHVFVTAGNTAVLIDRVRCITNIFTGRTGAAIAAAAHERGHRVTLATSHPETVSTLGRDATDWRVLAYRTFDELRGLMESALREQTPDALVHCAAVSDYLAAGVYATVEGTTFQPEDGRWQGDRPALVDRSAGKVKSDEPELWLRLVRTPKLIDLVRSEWGFRGILVKFKLEVGVSDPDLLDLAETSRRHSGAELMVANTLEGASSWAMLGPINGQYERVSRADL